MGNTTTESADDRQPYATPALRPLGTLTRLTGTGSAGTVEDDMAKAGPTHDKP